MITSLVGLRRSLVSFRGGAQRTHSTGGAIPYTYLRRRLPELPIAGRSLRHMPTIPLAVTLGRSWGRLTRRCGGPPSEAAAAGKLGRSAGETPTWRRSG